MNCPLCIDSVLDVTYHAGIEVDICPRCRGVWLDRGELDRLVAGPVEPSRPSPAFGERASDELQGDLKQTGKKKSGRKKSKQQRKKTLADKLGDVFEEIIDL